MATKKEEDPRVHRYVCSLCGLNLFSTDPVVARALRDLHIKTHAEQALQGIEEMLRAN